MVHAQFWEQPSFVDALDRELVHGQRGVNDGPVTVQRHRFPDRLPPRRGDGAPGAGLMSLNRFGKARRAEAAL
jgi:hypothetical protein